MLHFTEFSFMWMRPCNLMDDPDPDARYAVVFTAQGPCHDQPLLLAYTLARFHEQCTPSWGLSGPKMVGVEFKFSASAIHGVMLYDQGLEGWYRAAHRNALSAEDKRSVFHGDIPVTVWNVDAGDFGGGKIHSLMETYLQLGRFVRQPCDSLFKKDSPRI
jgi:hypothetical protein